MKHFYRLAMILVFGAGFGLAQTGIQNPQSTPPTFPSQQPGAQHLPDESSGQASTPSTSAITKAQSDIQTALRRQLPASADSVTVTTSDDNKIKLTGTVTSEMEKNQIEQVARSAAPDLMIENKLTVSNPPGGPMATPPSATNPAAAPSGTQRPDNSGGPTGTPNKPIPPMGSSFMPQSSSSSGSQTTNPNTGAQSGSNPGSQQSGNQTSPAAAQSGSSGDVQSNIQKALQQDPTLANANITATVNDNKVELTGTVADKEQKKKAKEIAESNAGGMKVVDHLKVEHSKGGKDNTTPPKY